MASLKNKLIFVAFALVSIAIVIDANNLVVGRRQPGDSRIYYERIRIVGRWNNFVSTRRIVKVHRWNQAITYIRALEGGFRGGSAGIIRGGLNQKNVTILLTSPKSRPLNYTLEVYAR